ncbi:polyketide cyclase/dehydrase/lipid transport protein [Halopolyspora algeriensis]|uniref:Polyketide cyclase/dehydrase/lipid transport protein n=1 Tax=Halopolyspora algeriensis TaxID=1500506 RepID=A0A368VN79_9ACTN|nr:SRPBCC family protein [Halopolyspora algeriensis]RCW43179.1 polyketide cyclase/dehydrase/lipid transport protein [Halopolyspora algeriensis]TQM56237.1 polyketide cyclase/dehydrase/lipid transport protein [Halopolyspora algeriensis]
MAKAYASAVIAATADRVWQIVRDFNGLPEWHPAIASSEIEGSRPSAEVGCVRRLTMRDGGTVRERLTALDDLDRSYTYEIVEGPFPIRRYLATIRVAEITATGSAFAEWYAHYDADAADEPELDRTFSVGVFAAGLQGLSRSTGG